MSISRQIQQIKDGIASLELDFNVYPVELYVSYLAELSRWNKAYNLTAIHDFDSMVSHHILDSLSIYPYIYGNRCLDVGTGAGLPGLVLALANPDVNWVLIDSKVKKIRFLNHVVRTLDIRNIELVHERIEVYQPESRFDLIVSRAFSNLETYVEKTTHLLAGDGRLLAMKGKIQKQELDGIKNSQFQLHNLRVPGINTERNLVVIR